MLQPAGERVESQAMTTTEIAKLALLISGHLSDMTAAEIVSATEELTKRLDGLPGPAELWSYQARDAALTVVRDVHEERKRRQMAIPRIAAAYCEPAEGSRISCSDIAAMAWALARSETRDDLLRETVSAFVRCAPADIRVTVEYVPRTSPEYYRFTGFFDRIHGYDVRETVDARYTVRWPGGSSTCILRNVVRP
jgi:hypothetical protein